MKVLILLVGILAMTAHGEQQLLVSGEWLAQHLNDSNLVVLHVGSSQDYEAGHIPGARLVGVGDLSITDERGMRVQLPSPEALQQTLGNLGISDSSRIVVYAGTSSVQSATRVWFTLDYLGLADRASLLDGGLALWRSEGRSVSSEAPKVETKTVTIKPRPDLVVDAAWVREHLNDPSVQIIDARTSEFYSGASAGNMPRAGHIPGAHSVPFPTVFDRDGRLKPAAALREMMASSNRTVVSYCHIGLQASVVYFAARYLGESPKLYDGSFQDWSNRSELPVETAAP